MAFWRRFFAFLVLLSLVSSEIAPLSLLNKNSSYLYAGPNDGQEADQESKDQQAADAEAESAKNRENLEALDLKLATGAGPEHPWDHWGLLQQLPLTALFNPPKLDPREAADATIDEQANLFAEKADKAQNQEPVSARRAKAKQEAAINAFLRNMKASELSVSLQNDRGEEIARSSARNPQVLNSSEHGDYQVVLLFKGTPIQLFRYPVKSAVIFENNLIVHCFDGSVRYVDIENDLPLLGRTEAPVRHLYSKGEAKDVSLSTKNGKPVLVVNSSEGKEVTFNKAQMKLATIPQEIAMNTYTHFLEATRNLDPKGELYKTRAESMISLLGKSFQSYVDLNGEQMRMEADSVDSAALQNLLTRTREAQSRALDRGPLVDSYTKDAINEQKLLGRFPLMKQTFEKQREFFERLTALLSRMRLPLPNREATVIESLKMMAATYKSGQMYNAAQTADIRTDAILNIVNHRYVRVGATLTTIGLFVGFAPHAAAQVVEVLGGYLANIGHTAVHALHQTFSVLSNVHVVWDAYVANGNFHRFIIGVMSYAGLCVGFYMIPHLMIHVPYLAKDFIAEGQWKNVFKMAFNGFFTKKAREAAVDMRNFFVERENRLQNEDLTNQSKNFTGGAEKSGNAAVTYTDQDTKELEAIIAKLDGKEAGSVEALKGNDINTVGSALKHFIWGDSNFGRTAKYFHIPVYLTLFSIRSFALFVRTACLMIAYPKVFRSVTYSADPFSKPSVFNGFDDPIYRRLFYLFRGDRTLRNKWESKILSVESAIQENVLQSAFEVACRNVANFKDFEIWAKNPVESFRSFGIWGLGQKQRSFFLKYAESLQRKAMRKFLLKLLPEANADVVDRMSDQEVKQRTLHLVDELKIGAAEAKDLVASCMTPELEKESLAYAEKRFSIGRAMSETKSKIFASLEGKMAVKRLRRTNAGLQDPLAVARAIRNAKASLLDVPMEFALTMFLSAGIDSGMNKPLHTDFSGPLSLFYLSSNVFLTGFYLNNAVLAFMASIPSRLQANEVLAGKFGAVPRADYEGGFARWFAQQLREPSNSFVNNHKLWSTLIAANIPAYTVWLGATNAIGLGRFDSDGYAFGYGVSFLTPFSVGGGGSAQMWAENAFDAAGYYDLKDIPSKFWNHPLAFEYLNRKMQSRRYRSAVFFKLYENVTGIIFSNLNNANMPGHGSRSFLRAILGGTLVGETLVGRVLDPGIALANKLHLSPISAFLRGCRFALTNNVH